MAGIKRGIADAAFSEIIRERSDWTCECCGKQFPLGSSRRSLHASHYFSRRHRGLRFHPSNTFAHCFTCHQRFGENPDDFSLWVEKTIGEGMVEMLRERRNSIYKMDKGEEKLIATHYKDELRIMREKRADGETGYLEFISWY